MITPEWKTALKNPLLIIAIICTLLTMSLMIFLEFASHGKLRQMGEASVTRTSKTQTSSHK